MRCAAVHVLISVLIEALLTGHLTVHLTVHITHLTGHHFCAGYAASVIQIELIGDVVLTVVVDTRFTAACGAVDLSAAADEVDVTVTVDAVAV